MSASSRITRRLDELVKLGALAAWTRDEYAGTWTLMVWNDGTLVYTSAEVTAFIEGFDVGFERG